MAAVFQIGKVPVCVKTGDDIVAGVVACHVADAGIGVVPVHTVTGGDIQAGVVPISLEDAAGIGIVEIDNG